MRRRVAACGCLAPQFRAEPDAGGMSLAKIISTNRRRYITRKAAGDVASSALRQSMN